MTKADKWGSFSQDLSSWEGSNSLRDNGVGILTPAPPLLDNSRLKCPDPRTTLQKRARRKAISHPLAMALERVAGGPLMGNAYRRTHTQCGTILEQKDGRVKTWRCSYRWCAVCGAIRSAKMFDAYGDELMSWSSPVLVTLTIPNVSGNKLRPVVSDLHKKFQQVWRLLKKQGYDVKLVRTTEVTYNVKTDTYHPHLHCLVSEAVVGRLLIEYWLKKYPTAKRAAQDIRSANSGSIAEVVKYSTKLMSNVKDKDGTRGVVPVENLNIIFTALRGLRLWAAVGISSKTGKDEADDTKEIETDSGTTAIVRPTDRVAWWWVQSVRDWVDLDSGEVLTGYQPSSHFDGFIKKIETMAEGFS